MTSQARRPMTSVAFLGAVTLVVLLFMALGPSRAAATAIIDEGTTGGEEVPPLKATIDHPFLWLIRDRITGTVLFVGRVLDPSETAR